MDGFEKMVLCDPSGITKEDMEQVSDLYARHAADKTYAGTFGEKLNDLKREIYNAPPAKRTAGERIKFILVSLLLLVILAVLKLTPAGEFLVSEEGSLLFMGGGVVLSAIIGLCFFGVVGLFVAAIAAMLAVNIVYPIFMIGYVPILIVGMLLLLLRAFRSSRSLRKKRDAWLESHGIPASLREVGAYAESIRGGLKQIGRSVYAGSAEKYFAEAMGTIEYLHIIL